MREQADDRSVQMMIVFESEEKAREREQDPRRQPKVQELQARMGTVFEGPPNFVNFEVVDEYPA